MGEHRREYLNGFSKSGRLMRKEDQPRLKYNKTKKIYTLYYGDRGSDGKAMRCRISFESFEDFRNSGFEVAEFKEIGIVCNLRNFQEAKRCGVSRIYSRRTKPKQEVKEKVRNAEYLERAEINLRYYAKHKARYEFMKLYKEMNGRVGKAEMEQEYDNYVAKYYKESE